MSEYEPAHPNTINGLTMNAAQCVAWKLLNDHKKRYCLLYGGSRSGKTLLILCYIIIRALIAPNSQHLIARNTTNAADRSIIRRSFPEVWKMVFGKDGMPMPKYDAKLYYYTLPNGSQIWVGGIGDDKGAEKLLGTDYDTVWLNEANQIPFPMYELVKSRLSLTTAIAQEFQVGENPLTHLVGRYILDLNPDTKNGWTYRTFFKGENYFDGSEIPNLDAYGYVQLNPKDNAENLPDEYLLDLQRGSKAHITRFWTGEYRAASDNALWDRAILEKHRVDKSKSNSHHHPCKMVRVVIGVDPAMTGKITSDLTGIIVVGLGEDGKGYVLQDDSGRYAKPSDWGRRVRQLYVEFDADMVVAEINQGGEMVEGVIKAEGTATARNLNYVAVRAADGKYTRAEPLATSYYRDRVSHVGNFRELEDEMCDMVSDLDRVKKGYSPDRVDALVYAFTYLFPQITIGSGMTGVLDYRPPVYPIM